MLKIGVLGTGHLGQIHIKCIQLIENISLIGLYDIDLEKAKTVAQTYGVKAFEQVESLLDEVDIVDIVTSTPAHFELAKLAIERGKHVFIEKPVTHRLEEAKELIALEKTYGVKVQVGHVERFNPAFLALEEIELNPKFIEAHRLAMFNPRGTDVSVVLDLMIHDLDILLHLVDAEVKNLSASGVAVVSDTPDIANAHIEFENGCVANITASRMSFKMMRKMRLFQEDAYISVDFLEKKTDVVRLYDEEKKKTLKEVDLMELPTKNGKKYIHLAQLSATSVNAIKMEIETFVESINENKPVRVSLADGYKALKLAYQIKEAINMRNIID